MRQEGTQFRTTLRTMHLEAHTSQSNHDHAEQLKFQHISEQYKYGEIRLKKISSGQPAKHQQQHQRNLVEPKVLKIQQPSSRAKSAHRFIEAGIIAISSIQVSKNTLSIQKLSRGRRSSCNISTSIQTYSGSSKSVFIRQAPDELTAKGSPIRKRDRL